MSTITKQLSIKTIENNVLLCGGCIFSAPVATCEGGIICHLDPDVPSSVFSITHFCGRGMWYLDGEVLEFKDAWRKLHEQKGAVDGIGDR
jgi:hypothetical protein